MIAIVRKFGLACALLAGLAGCAAPPLPSTAAPPSADDAYYVIALKPNTINLDIFEGTVKDGVFSTGFKWVDHWYSSDDNGFLVVKARGGATYGVVMIALTFSRGSIFGQSYTPNARTMVFDVPAGKVVYITDVGFSPSTDRGRYPGPGLVPSYRQNFAAAQAYMREHYPLLAGKLEQGSFRFVPGT